MFSLLRLTIDFWKTTMDIQAYIIHNKTGKSRSLPMTFDTGAYITSIDTNYLRRAGYDVELLPKFNLDSLVEYDNFLREISRFGLRSRSSIEGE